MLKALLSNAFKGMLSVLTRVTLDSRVSGNWGIGRLAPLPQ